MKPFYIAQEDSSAEQKTESPLLWLGVMSSIVRWGVHYNAREMIKIQIIDLIWPEAHPFWNTVTWRLCVTVMS